MSRITFRNQVFNCHIECDQCTFIKLDGLRCRNRVCFGIPTCWVHTVRLWGLRVKQSTIPGAGKGLFTTRPIAINTDICPYIGQRINNNCMDLRYQGDTAPYAVTHQSINVDSACRRGVAAMANGLFGANGHSLPFEDHNATLEWRQHSTPRGIWLYATKAIAQGEEIFAWYGDDYHLDGDHVTRRCRSVDNRPC